MKLTISLILVSIIILSCGGSSSDNEQTKNLDTLFLGFTFGMTEKEYRIHFSELLMDGKFVKKSVFGKPEQLYEFDFGPENEASRYGYAKLTPVFENNALWKLNVRVRGDDAIYLPIVQFDYLEDLYDQKHGKHTISDVVDFESVWTYKNASIRLTMYGDFCVIVYEDLHRLEQFESREKNVSDI